MPSKLSITGDRDLERTLKTLGDKVQKRILRGAVTAGARPIQRAAKTKAAKESGLLKKALGTKVKANKNGTVTVRIGPRTNIEGTYKGRKRRPVRYAHLVEKGFIDAKGNFHAPQAYLGPAADEQAGAAINATAAKLSEGIAREAAKGGIR